MSKLQKIARQVQWSIGKHGVLGTAGIVAARLTGKRTDLVAKVHPFDVQYGVETSGLIGGGALGVGHPHDRYVVSYYGVQPSRLRLALAKWQSTEGTQPPADQTFVDIGCGKGRAMMIASELPFRQVIGVEMNSEMAAVARENLAKWQAAGNAQSPMKVLEGDATEIDLPAGPLLIFLYNPFHAPVLRRLLQRIEADERSIDLIYMVPEQAEVFQEFPRFKLLWCEVLEMSETDREADLVSTPDDRCNLYRLQ